MTRKARARKEGLSPELKELIGRLADEGKLMEAGWVVFRDYLPENAPQYMADALRAAFMSGALHLFKTTSLILTPEMQTGQQDLKDHLHRVELIDAELAAFQQEVVEFGARRRRNQTEN